MTFQKEMESDEWDFTFAFVVDIMQNLNELNTKLRGKGVLVPKLYLEVNKPFNRNLSKTDKTSTVPS